MALLRRRTITSEPLQVHEPNEVIQLEDGTEYIPPIHDDEVYDPSLYDPDKLAPYEIYERCLS